MKRRVRKRTVRAAEGRRRTISTTPDPQDCPFSAPTARHRPPRTLPTAGTNPGVPAAPASVCPAPPPRTAWKPPSSVSRLLRGAPLCSLVSKCRGGFHPFLGGEEGLPAQNPPQLPARGGFLPDFPTLSAPITRTFTSVFRVVGPGISRRAAWSGVKLALRRSGRRSPMPSAAVPGWWSLRLPSRTAEQRALPAAPRGLDRAMPLPAATGAVPRAGGPRTSLRLGSSRTFGSTRSLPGQPPERHRPSAPAAPPTAAREAATAAPHARGPLAGPPSPLSVPHGDGGNACKEWWSISRVVECLVSNGALFHK